MGKIIISENISLDGVVQDPTGEEGFRHGGWFRQIGDKDREAWAKVLLDEALGAEAMLLGRRSYEFFAARWPSRSGDYADRLNSMPKYVVSSTLQEPKWTNATVLKGGAVSEVSKLKQELAGDIVVYGSAPRSACSHCTAPPAAASAPGGGCTTPTARPGGCAPNWAPKPPRPRSPHLRHRPPPHGRHRGTAMTGPSGR